MKKIRFFQAIQAKLILIYVLLILIAMQLIGIYFIRTLESYFKTEFSNEQIEQTMLLAQYVSDSLAASPEAAKSPEEKNAEAQLNEEYLRKLFSISNSEIQIIDVNGEILSSSILSNESLVGKKNTQTEVISALQGVQDNHRMFTDLDGFRKMVVATPVLNGQKVIGAVYTVSSMEGMYTTLSKINGIFIVGTLFALALTALLGVFLSHTITNPIKEITKQATAVAEGNFDQKVQVRGQDEIGQLAHTFNIMMNRLKEALSINEEEKDKLASVLSNMNDGVIATDISGKIIVMNRRAVQMLGLEDEQEDVIDITNVLGLTRDQIDHFVYSEDHTAVLQALKVGEETVSVKVTFTPIQRREEGVTGTIAVLQNISEQERLEQSRKEFVANVSHELRTPLTTIKSYLEALEDGALEDSQLATRFVGVARNETERMIRLVNDLLQLSRLDSRQAIIAKETTMIGDMLDEVIDRFSFQGQQRRITIQLMTEPRLPEVMLDRDQIDQVLDNLISNAIKYTPDEGIIEIRAVRQGNDYIAVSVQDNGIGIPKKDLDKIFDRFYRVDKARSRNMGGTGLGLSIAREIVRAHGGQITLESELNKGTKVTFTLPIGAQEGETA